VTSSFITLVYIHDAPRSSHPRTSPLSDMLAEATAAAREILEGKRTPAPAAVTEARRRERTPVNEQLRRLPRCSDASVYSSKLLSVFRNCEPLTSRFLQTKGWAF